MGGAMSVRHEPVHRGLPVNVTRAKDDRRKGGLVDGIREMLRLKAKAGVPSIDHSTFADQRTVEVVGSVELNPGVSGVHLHDSARARVAGTGFEAKPVRTP